MLIATGGSLDVDKDGKLSRHEYEAGFPLMDLDCDGRICKRDLKTFAAPRILRGDAGDKAGDRGIGGRKACGKAVQKRMARRQWRRAGTEELVPVDKPQRHLCNRFQNVKINGLLQHIQRHTLASPPHVHADSMLLDHR